MISSNNSSFNLSKEFKLNKSSSLPVILPTILNKTEKKDTSSVNKFDYIYTKINKINSKNVNIKTLVLLKRMKYKEDIDNMYKTKVRSDFLKNFSNSFSNTTNVSSSFSNNKSFSLFKNNKPVKTLQNSLITNFESKNENNKENSKILDNSDITDNTLSYLQDHLNSLKLSLEIGSLYGNIKSTPDLLKFTKTTVICFNLESFLN